MIPSMFFLFGLVSLTGQVLLLREILVIFHGTEISIGIFFGAWLSGIGIGASVGAWLVKRQEERLQEIFLHSLAALGLSVVFHILLIRTTPLLFGASPAELTPLRGILAAIPAGSFITAFLTGFLFPVGCKAGQERDGRAIARLYALEALGSLAAGLLFTFVLVRLLPPLRIAAISAIILAAGVIACGFRFRTKGPLMSGLALLMLGVALLSPVGTRVIDWSVHTRWAALHPGLQLLESRPTPYEQVEIARLGSQLSLFGNGKIVSSFPDPNSADRFAAMIMAQEPDARAVLLIGGGISSLVASLLEYPIKRLDVVEPDPWVLPIAEKYLPEREARALKDPRVRVLSMDGRLYVNRLSANRYDAIVSIAPDPVSAFWNRYYTVEFFQAVSRALTPRGIFLTSVTAAENFWGTDVASFAGSVYHTLKEVFPTVAGTPGDVTLLFASRSPDALILDPTLLALRYQRPAGSSFDPKGFETLLPPERTAFVRRELEQSPVLMNTDDKPISSSLAMILWGRFSGTEQLEFLNTVGSAGLKAFLIPIAFFLFARLGFRARWGPRAGAEQKFQSLLAMAAMGASAMGSQIVLIYAYQSLFGHVFERIGLIAAIFMAGLVVGSFAAGEALRRIFRKATALVVLLAIFAAICLAVTPVVRLLAGREPWQIEFAICAMVLGCGLLTGAVFPIAAARHLEFNPDAGATSGWTDAADHYGAAAGALVTGVLLVPLLGAADACLVLVMVVITPAVLILAESLFARIEGVLKSLRPSGSNSFPYIRLSWVLVFAVAAAVAWNVLIGVPGQAPLVQFPDDTLKKLSGSESFTFKDTPFPHFVGTSTGQSGSTVSLSTIPPAAEVRGYGGPINLLLSLSEQGTIKGVSLVASRETPSYVRGLEEWLLNFRGKSVMEPLQDQVDAVSGATITTKAVMEILNRTGRQIAGPILGLPAVQAPAEVKGSWRASVQDVRVWAAILLLMFFAYAFHSRSSTARWACLVASFLVLGIYLNAPFTELDAAALFQGRVPAAGTWWRNVLFVGVIAISVLWGQAFCGFLCPFGALQEFLSRQGFRQRPSPEVETAGRYVKFVALALLLCLFLVTDDSIWFNFSPLQHFFHGHGLDIVSGHLEIWVLLLCVVALVASVFYFRFWCRYLCPAGAFLALFNKVSLLRRYAPQPIPARCDLGVKFPEDLDCIRCHRCLTRRGSTRKDQ